MGSQGLRLFWKNHNTHVIGICEKLWEARALCDVTLACEGGHIRAHRVILSACSPYFQDLFEENPCEHPTVVLKDVSYNHLVALLNFIYRGEVEVDQHDLHQVLSIATNLGIKELTDVAHKLNQDPTHPLAASNAATHPQPPPPSSKKRKSTATPPQQNVPSNPPPLRILNNPIPIAPKNASSHLQGALLNAQIPRLIAAKHPMSPAADADRESADTTGEHPPLKREKREDEENILNENLSDELHRKINGNVTRYEMSPQQDAGSYHSGEAEDFDDQSSTMSPFGGQESDMFSPSSAKEKKGSAGAHGVSQSPKVWVVNEEDLKREENLLNQSYDPVSPSSGPAAGTMGTVGRPHKCSLCGKRFRLRQYLSEHLKRHLAREYTALQSMDLTQSRFLDMAAKQLEHNSSPGVEDATETRPFQCPVCMKAFKRKHHLTDHIRLHTGEKRYKCYYCDECFVATSIRARHISKLHFLEAQAAAAANAANGESSCTKQDDLSPSKVSAQSSPSPATPNLLAAESPLPSDVEEDPPGLPEEIGQTV